MIQSYYEVNVRNVGAHVDDEQFTWMVSSRWVRLVFDYFRQRCGGRTPIVVDAVDVVYRSSELTDLLCKRLCLDQEGVLTMWEPSERDPDDAGHFFRTRLNASMGIERSENGVSPQSDKLF